MMEEIEFAEKKDREKTSNAQEYLRKAYRF
jgi:hypothetical protein